RAARSAELVFARASELADALRDEAGEALAQFIAISDGMGRDRDGAKRLMSSLEVALSGPALTALRADLSFADRTVPAKVARGRATRDIEATLDKDKGIVAALLEAANFAV